MNLYSATRTRQKFNGHTNCLQYPMQRHTTMFYRPGIIFHKIDLYNDIFEYVLKMVSFGSKDCTKELKLECAYILGQTSKFLPFRLHHSDFDPLHFIHIRG